MKPQDSRTPEADVEAMLRKAMPDDLPRDVEVRLDRTLEDFVEARRRRPHRSRPWGPAVEWLAAVPAVRRRRLAAVPASVLLACGLAWHGAAGPAALAESLTQAHVTVSIADAARRASDMTCTGDVLPEIRSPGEFAALVYGGWIQRGTPRRLEGALYVEFVDPGLGLTYELHVDPETMLPGEIRRVTAGADGSLIPAFATCSWTARPLAPRPVREGRER
jgi:hypothetical protein